jgi:hypothetical protein
MEVTWLEGLAASQRSRRMSRDYSKVDPEGILNQRAYRTTRVSSYD